VLRRRDRPANRIRKQAGDADGRAADESHAARISEVRQPEAADGARPEHDGDRSSVQDGVVRLQRGAGHRVRSAARDQSAHQVTRSRALLALVLAASLGADLAAGQGWRAQALTSFDEAWRTIHDTYYDPTFGGLDWDAVKAELRPKVQTADSPETVRQIIRDMLG